MSLAAGTRLGPYEVLGLLGAGGMGEVYKANDTRLGREVAIKVLPGDRLADEGRRRRFVQEAQAASALNHPHIITIHEIETAEDHDFIVMEYVRGKSLDALIPRQGMRLSEALRIAISVADALTAAHARGIIHRDLKPANVIVGADGAVKVLDFGLAKLVNHEDPSDAETPTVTTPAALSAPGTLAGTAAYMAPEQATGGPVDPRSDIFSFGAMLYEMVTGARPFAGTSTAETLSAVIRAQPKAPSGIIADVPSDLEKVILRCLRKDPQRRFQHIDDVKVALQDIKEESESQSSPPSRAPAKVGSARRHWMAWAGACIVVLAAIAGTMVWRRWRPVLSAPNVVQLTSERSAGAGTFSPDGTHIAYASAGENGANWDIWVKIIGQVEAQRITTDAAAEDFPVWSPDGTQIAFLRYRGGITRGQPFFSTGTVYLVSPSGGVARRLSDFPARLQLSWSPDGRWLAAAKAPRGNEPPGGIYLMSVENGDVRALTQPKPPAFDLSPAFSADGKSLAYASCEGGGRPVCDVQILSLDSQLQPQGEPRRLTHQRLWLTGLCWLPDGHSVVYTSGDAAGGHMWRVLTDSVATPQLVELGWKASSPSSTRNRDRLAFVREVGDTDLYRFRLDSTRTSPLVQSTFFELQPQYSPDGRRIVFASWRSGQFDIWVADAEGSNPMRLTRGPGRSQGYPGWSPDGQSVVFDSQADDGRVTVWTIHGDGSGLRQVTHGPGDDITPSWSRDPRFIYFVSNRTGRHEVWRVPFAGSPEEQLTREGGSFPFESADSRTLYYKKGGIDAGDAPLMARPTAGGESRQVLPCVRVFGYTVAARGLYYTTCETGDSPQRTLRYWDATTGRDRPVATLDAEWIGGLSVSPDGQSIVFGRGTSSSDLIMIENFH
jgi:serine/threonine protein kinase